MDANALEDKLAKLTQNHFDSGNAGKWYEMKVTCDIPGKAKEIGKRLDGLVAAYKAETLGAR